MNAVRVSTVLLSLSQSTVLNTTANQSAASNYLVTFMRMVTSTQIQSEPETYEPFLIHPDTGETMGVREFCKVVVEVLGKEAGEHSSFFSSHVLYVSRVLLISTLHRSCATDGYLASTQSKPENCVPRRAQPRWPCRVCHVQSCKQSKRDSFDTIIPVSDKSIMVLAVWVSDTNIVNACSRPGHYDILDTCSSESPPIDT